jgi:hypothetical protein
MRKNFPETKKNICMRHVLLTLALVIATTVSFGQAPKNMDKQVPQRLASNKQHERRTPQRRENSHPFFLRQKQGYAEAGRAFALRTAQASKLLLDSITLILDSGLEMDEENQKTVYEYNYTGNLILEIEYEWDVDAQSWKEARRYGYNNTGDLILEIYRYYDYEYEEEIIAKCEYSYDGNGNRTQTI